MVSRGGGRAKMGVSSVGAEFFKIFLPHLTSHQLLIPPDFLKDFSRTIKEKAILKDISGKTWHVDVEKTPNGVFLKNGWQSFVSYHCLKVGELLVFRYVGNYSFVVKIFGTNGCKKESSFAVKNTETHVKIEEEEIETKPTRCKRARSHEEGHSLRGNERSGHSRGLEQENEIKVQNVAYELPESGTCPYFVSAPSQKEGYTLRIPKGVVRRHNLHFEPEMVLHNANGKEWPRKSLHPK